MQTNERIAQVRMREMRVRGERVEDARRICRGVKSVFVLDALETADIATIRPSFREKERQCKRERERGWGVKGSRI